MKFVYFFLFLFSPPPLTHTPPHGSLRLDLAMAMFWRWSVTILFLSQGIAGDVSRLCAPRCLPYPSSQDTCASLPSAPIALIFLEDLASSRLPLSPVSLIFVHNVTPSDKGIPVFFRHLKFDRLSRATPKQGRARARVFFEFCLCCSFCNSRKDRGSPFLFPARSAWFFPSGFFRVPP